MTSIVLVAVEAPLFTEAFTVATPSLLLVMEADTLPVPPAVFAVFGETVPRFVSKATATPLGATRLFSSTTVTVIEAVAVPLAETEVGKAEMSPIAYSRCTGEGEELFFDVEHALIIPASNTEMNTKLVLLIFIYFPSLENLSPYNTRIILQPVCQAG